MFTPNLVIGVAIMVVGSALLLERFGVAAVSSLLNYWPVLLMLFGASVAAQGLQRRDPAAPPLPRPMISPGLVLLIVIVAMLGSQGFRVGRTTEASGDGERVNLFGVMGSARHTSTATNFSGAQLGGLMGRSTLDLRGATIAPGQEAVVNVFVAMGRATILVPEGWSVDTSALPVMGAVEDVRWPRRQAPVAESGEPPVAEPVEQPVEKPVEKSVGKPAEGQPAAPGPAPRLVLRGFVMMGKVGDPVVNGHGIGRPERPGRPELPEWMGAVTPQFAFGVIIMLIGAALLLDRLGIVNAGFVFRLWPLMLIAFGVMHFTRGAREHRFWGLFWAFTGSWLLLRNLNVIELGFWELFLPIMFIAFGVNLVLRTLSDSGYVKPDREKSSHLFAVFGGSQQRFDGKPFEGAYMTAVMGGCELDLRRATMRPGEERTVVVFALMGGHGIKVPVEWDVVLTVVPIMGGVEDKRQPPVAPPPLESPRPRLIIRGNVVMGGLELKN